MRKRVKKLTSLPQKVLNETNVLKPFHMPGIHISFHHTILHLVNDFYILAHIAFVHLAIDFYILARIAFGYIFHLATHSGIHILFHYTNFHLLLHSSTHRIWVYILIGY